MLISMGDAKKMAKKFGGYKNIVYFCNVFTLTS